MTTDAARQAVLNTNELLERIILHLPMKNIFAIQRVCQRFKAVIATSPDIQTKLFLRLRNEPEENWTLNADESRGNVATPDDIYFRKVDDEELHVLRHRPVRLNPLLDLVTFDDYRWAANHRILLNHNKSEFAQMGFSQGHFDSEASFLKMYITDPPCRMASARIIAQFVFDPEGIESTRGAVSTELVQSDQGLTIGDVVLARGNVLMDWGSEGLGNHWTADAQLEDVIRETAVPIIMDDASKPVCWLQLAGVVIARDEERITVSSGRQEDTS